MIGESRQEGQEYQTLEHDTSEGSDEAHSLSSELGVEDDEEARGQWPMRVVDSEVGRQEQGRRQDRESHCSSIGLLHTPGAATPLQAALPVACSLACPRAITVFAHRHTYICSQSLHPAPPWAPGDVRASSLVIHDRVRRLEQRERRMMASACDRLFDSWIVSAARERQHFSTAVSGCWWEQPDNSPDYRLLHQVNKSVMPL